MSPQIINLIIPAAGHGTRMKISYPKTLYKILGKPILGHILDSVEPLIDNIIIVVSLEGKKYIERYLKFRGTKKIKTVVQFDPIGMADAINIGLHSFALDNKCEYLISLPTSFLFFGYIQKKYL